MTSIAIFGGCGFIGINFCKKIIEKDLYEKIYLIDILKPKDHYLKQNLRKFLNSKKVELINHDVRNPIKNLKIEKLDTILNLAAIHRMPGHEDFEYFETNVNGARNVTTFADKINCKNIIFTSSISVYGSGNHYKNEDTPTIPDTPYGKSKLEAEEIHLKWLNKNSSDKILLICRPGVVFGAGENGNVSRLVKIIKKRMFFYFGNKNLKKAGIYIDELFNQIFWVNKNQINHKFYNKVIFNGVFEDCNNIKEYAEEISKILNVSSKYLEIPKVIFQFFLFLSSFITKKLSSKNNFNYLRLSKLFISNFVISKFLSENDYTYNYNLKTSLKKWSKSNTNDW